LSALAPALVQAVGHAGLGQVNVEVSGTTAQPSEDWFANACAAPLQHRGQHGTAQVAPVVVGQVVGVPGDGNKKRVSLISL